MKAQATTAESAAPPSLESFVQDGAEHDISSAKERFSADERNAMRAFIQRSEVRLSTMHRVAVGFLSGAGLLFLFPVFLRDGVLTVLRVLLDYTPAVIEPVGWGTVVSVGLTYLSLIYPFVLSLALPAVALILLLEDIVRFYFVGHPPSFSEKLFNPRFALTGVAFSPDESRRVKEDVLCHEYGSDLITYVVSRADTQSGYYQAILDPERLIVPNSRKLSRLLRRGIFTLAASKPMEQIASDDLVRVTKTSLEGEDESVERMVQDVDHFNAALGLSGLIERSLAEEVAHAEVSLVRHNLKLRRLVLRYFQALLILIWTSLVTFLMLPFLEEAGRFPVLVVFALAYFVWAALAPLIVHLPLTWLSGHGVSNIRDMAMPSLLQHDALYSFGTLTQRLCYLAMASAVTGLVLEIVLRI